MSRERVRELRDLALAERRRGSYRTAAKAYAELERLEPDEPLWPKGLAECLEHCGSSEEIVAALARAAVRYAARGFVVRATAMHKVILRRMPDNETALDAVVELQRQRVIGLARYRRHSVAAAALDASMHDEIDGVDPAVAVSAGVYEIAIEPVHDPARDLEIETLASSPLFARLSPESLRLVVDALRLLDVAPGAMLYGQGDPADSMYVVVDGAIALVAGAPPGVAIVELGAGDVVGVVGVVGLCSAAPRPVAAIARAPTRLLEIPRRSLDALLARAPELHDALLDLARQRVLAILLATHRLFAAIPGAARVRLADWFRFFEVTEGATLVGRGAAPDHLFVVMTGRLELVDSDGEVVAGLGPGSLAADTEFLSGTPVAMPLVARRKAFVLGLPRADFAALAREYPNFLDDVLREATAPFWDPAIIS